jgi:hypothetical protein
VYTEKASRSSETQVKESERHQLIKPAVAEHSTQSGHRITLHEAETLAKESGYVDRIVKEQQKQNYIRAI